MTATISQTDVITDDQRARAKRAAVATSVGNALEWFDILVYASFAVVISKLFFPLAGGVTGLLLVFGTFGLSYVIRPLGAMVLGNYADTAGRKKALTLTIALMTVGTGIMAFAPTADSIGVWAGVVILVSRLLQGFSAGGEFGTSTAFLIEHPPTTKLFTPVGRSPPRVPPCSSRRPSALGSTGSCPRARSSPGVGASRLHSACSLARSGCTSG
jgi:MHS family proline/betaine transporter-like MFS transporter